MAKQIITPAMAELRAAITAAEQIAAKPELTKADEVRVNLLLSKIAALKSGAIAPDNYVERWFRSLVAGNRPEQRGTDILAGTQTPTYTQGIGGGFLVPQEFHNEMLLGLSQNDPLLDETVVTLLRSNGLNLRPYTVPGWDLSTFTALKVTEANQQNALTVPNASRQILNGYMYRATLDDTFEFEDDAFENGIQFMRTAYEQAFAKGIGADLATGNGSTAPQGIVTGAANSGITTAAAGVISGVDIESIYFSVDRVYRNNPKCAWAMSDTIYQAVRKAVDDSHRPLINVVGDKELLMGKPILISPTISSTAGQKGIVFGDFAYFVVRISRMDIIRNLNAAQGGAEFGKALYTGRMRADAKVCDPTGGTKPPLVYATLHA